MKMSLWKDMYLLELQISVKYQSVSKVNNIKYRKWLYVDEEYFLTLLVVFKGKHIWRWQRLVDKEEKSLSGIRIENRA